MPQIESACPYTIWPLCSTGHANTYLIREHDAYGEYPNIYAKVVYEETDHEPIAIILSDTGTGLEVASTSNERRSAVQDLSNSDSSTPVPERWNIASFLETTLNPHHAAPYVVLSSHCHYDHICGIKHFFDAKATLTVLCSSNDVHYLTPWRSLQKHSLCDALGLQAPKYDARWIEDGQTVSFIGRNHSERKTSSVTVIHTPGHTPDSLSWYDHDTNTLCVGDTFYERESNVTKSGSRGQWAREPPQPVVFTHDSNIVDWNASMHRLLDFVRYENRKLERRHNSSDPQAAGYYQDGKGTTVDFAESALPGEEWSYVTIPERRRVTLCSSHVTVSTDAEFALLEMLAFMLRIQLDQVPKEKADDIEGKGDVWLWDDSIDTNLAVLPQNPNESALIFSVKAPWSIIHRTNTKDSETRMPLTQIPHASTHSSILQHVMSRNQQRNMPTYLKSNALASVSHSSVMASRAAVRASSSARNE